MKLPFKFPKIDLSIPVITGIFRLLRRISIQNEYIIQQNERMIDIMSANQDHINTLTEKANKILAEVQALKNQPGAEVLDFSALDAALQNVDDVNEDAQAPSEPTEPAPATEEVPAPEETV